ncbi:MAG: HsdR family type I site-specific deoxyribonuclease [Melioribacteraceae bacterium]|nr:HsdR family type I site-specific deoxyribonuclease [Melioribacteraceae bacterium]
MSDRESFEFNEKYLSQIPALQLLINMGFEYLTPDQTLKNRQGKKSNIILESILSEQLRKINKIQFKGKDYLFSEENIQAAIQKLKNIKHDGLLRTNESVYDLITLGTALEQNIEGSSKSFNLKYIDWRNWERNIFHVTAEFDVERSRSTECARPDIVLFVNGIPVVVIESKSPKREASEAIHQSIRNQSDEYIPKLFAYIQMILAINKNEARYGTVGTIEKFWSIWKEVGSDEKELEEVVNKRLTEEQKHKLFSDDFRYCRKYFDNYEEEGDRLITEQDRSIYNLCLPERLIELIYKFIVFDSGIKKIARYQQYFVVKSTLHRIKVKDEKGVRKGGIIFHTQGSGKSLTMVMIVRNLALDPELKNIRIVLVTDRDDLDKQLANTFAACGMDPQRATSGKHLLELVSELKASIITTIINKFDKALNVRQHKEDSSDIFMLVDESHRTNYKSLAARMRQMFPKACYIGFTGTPLLKKEKNSFVKFGGLIEPHYPIRQAVEDQSVVPLLYEGRDVNMHQDKKAVDLWFDRHTHGLTQEQKADLKKKYARAEMLNKVDRVIYTRAFDISEHYREFWKGTGFKAQLVAPNKASAIKYQKYLNEFGYISSEIIISAPDTREGYEEIDDEPAVEVVKFWQKMMKRFGNEEEYNKQIINQFKNGDQPEILIVVSKLLTGFDAPRNTVLYLTTKLTEHTLLQAIARVNRLYENKDFGYIIDYASVLEELDKAMSMYDEFEGFDVEDLRDTVMSVKEEIKKLPQRHSELWDIFKAVKNSYDEEEYERLLSDQKIRDRFYECLKAYSKTLGIALSSDDFLMEVSDEKLREYKKDLRNFQNLRAAVKFRYAESISYKDYEPKIQKLLDTHIQANEVYRLNEPVNIFDEELFSGVKESQGVYGNRNDAAKADSIAHATKKVITEKMDEDPAFYQRFSKMIEDIIEAWKAKRISDLEYLNKISDVRKKVVTKQHDDVPDNIRRREDAMAYFGVIKPLVTLDDYSNNELEILVADISLAISNILKKNQKVNFWDDIDAQRTVINEIDDFLYDEIKGQKNIDLSLEQMDNIIEKTMQVAKHRRHV